MTDAEWCVDLDCRSSTYYPNWGWHKVRGEWIPYIALSIAPQPIPVRESEPMLDKKIQALMRDGKRRSILELVADLIAQDGLVNPYAAPVTNLNLDKRPDWATKVSMWEAHAGGFAARHVIAALKKMKGITCEWREIDAIKSREVKHLRVETWGISP